MNHDISFPYLCTSGYSSVSVTCTDTDECIADTDICSVNAALIQIVSLYYVCIYMLDEVLTSTTPVNYFFVQYMYDTL